jgi:hypothetical protein
MDGSTGAGVGAIALITGLMIRTVWWAGRRPPRNAQPYTPPAAPLPPSPPMRDPGLVATAQQDHDNPVASVRGAATAYLRGDISDDQYRRLRPHLLYLEQQRLAQAQTAAPHEPQDAIPPEYQQPRL